MEPGVRRTLERMHAVMHELERFPCSVLEPALLSHKEDHMSDSSSKVVAAETASAIAAAVGLLTTGGSRLVGWLVHRTKRTDQVAQHRSDVMEQFDRIERWCARVDDFIARSTEHRIADERFMARTETALTSLAQRVGRVERVQDHAAA